MSHTITPGLVDSSHWTYIAAVMAEGLEKVAEHSETMADFFPSAALQAAQDFFQTVSDAVENRIPVNAAAAANYYIAAQALRGVVPTRQSREGVTSIIRQYAHMVEGLASPHRLRSEEINEARDLSRFFWQIAENGEKEAYEQYVRLGQT